MSRDFKNDIGLYTPKYGVELRENLSKEVMKDSTPFPKTLLYEDIDREFKKWVETELEISFDGQKLPTHFMVSNQRFSEYIETWDAVDENKNLSLNFKFVTRENNPKTGTMVGNIKNIPGNKTFLMKRVEALDKNNRKYFIDYRMAQPLTVDLIYNLNIITNKFELLNEFNLLVHDKFKAINAYIRPNGHYIPMELQNVSDDSEYDLDDRRFYSQSYEIKVMAYIIKPDDFKVVEVPFLKIINLDDTTDNDYAEIEDITTCEPINPYGYKKMKLIINIGSCNKQIDFTMDTNFRITNVSSENIRWYEFKINGEFAFDKNWVGKEGIEMKPKDLIKITKISKYKTLEKGVIVIEGIDWQTIYNKDSDLIEEDNIVIN